MFSSTSSSSTTTLEICPHAKDPAGCIAEQAGFCWFPSHKVVVQVVQPAVPTVKVEPKPTQGVKRPAPSPALAGTSSLNQADLKRPRVQSLAQSQAAPVERLNIQQTQQQLPRKPKPAPTPIINTGARPTVAASLHSKVDRAKRQKILDLFFNEFVRIYAPIATQRPTLAHEHAFAQENALQKKCNNATTYTTMAIPILNRLKKRPVATSPTDTGIDGLYTPPVDAANANPHGALFMDIPPVEKFEPLVLSDADMTKHSYPTLSVFANLFAAAANPITQNQLLQQQQQKVSCARCRAEFTPKHDLDAQDWEACTYHRSARPILQVLNGTAPTSRTKVYPCCQLDQTSPGCATGPHVYKETEWVDLNSRIPFTVLPVNADPQWKVVGIDCEMSYTTGGMELTRVTVVDVVGGGVGGGKVLLDELVKPQFTVLDLNSDYSGITDLSKAKYTLQELHAVLSQYMSTTTILIGHGLENDLISLRLLHPRVIDTAALFPRPQPPAASNPSGTIWKNSLKVLCEKLLGKRIQVVNSTSLGHDSAEDARGAVELILFYLKQKEKGVLISY